MRTTLVLAVAGLLAFGAMGCSSDDSAQAVRDELATVQAERDDLVAQLDAPAARHEAAAETMQAIGAIWDDPESFGGEDGVAEAFSTLLAPGAVMNDAVFGAIPYVQGFINTMFGGDIGSTLDAEMDGYASWIAEDGSSGGSMWVWHGTNFEGNPFELVGLSLTTFDQDGRLLVESDSYPYPSDYVVEALFGAGTSTATQAAG